MTIVDTFKIIHFLVNYEAIDELKIVIGFSHKKVFGEFSTVVTSVIRQPVFDVKKPTLVDIKQVYQLKEF